MRAMVPRQMPMIANEIRVVTVPSAYSDGEVTFSVMIQISSGRVLSDPAVSSERVNSSYDSVKPNRATATRPGARIGTITRNVVCQALAPRSLAASSQALLSRDITANITSTPNGSVQDNCAPSAVVYQLVSMPSTLQIRPTPMPSTRPGATRLPIIR